MVLLSVAVVAAAEAVVAEGVLRLVVVVLRRDVEAAQDPAVALLHESPGSPNPKKRSESVKRLSERA
jgi:hypothetical protein